MKRKHLVAIGVSIPIQKILNWHFEAEEMNATKNINKKKLIFLWSCADKNVSSQKIISS